MVSVAVMREARHSRPTSVCLVDKHQHRITCAHRGALFIPESILATCYHLISWLRFCHVQCDGVTATGHSIVLEPAFQHIQVPLSTLLRESQVRFSVSKQDIPPSFLQCICLVVCPTTPPRVEMRTSMSHTLPARIPGKCFEELVAYWTCCHVKGIPFTDAISSP